MYSNLIELASNHRHLKLANRFGDLNFARASHGAVENSMAASHSIGFADNLHSLGGRFIPAVKDETMGSNQSGWSKIGIISPEGWTGGSTGSTKDTLGCVVESFTVLNTLESFFAVFRKRAVVDKPRHHFLEIIKKWFHVHRQVFDDLQAQ